ncbi:MAG: DeoR family transcriptional regulator [Gallintestinimicrobium sp.]
MYIEERHRAILEWLSQHGSISNTDIQKNFDVSYDSAKRDLEFWKKKDY